MKKLAMEVYISQYWLGLLTILLASGTFIGLVLIYFWVARLKKRFSPFTENALRLPGHTLRMRHTELSDDFLLYYVAYLFSAIGIALAFSLLTSDVRDFAIIFVVLFMLYLLRKVWSLFGILRTLRLGREGEEYVGQELNLLMCRGAHVFHDIPYDYGNIDHIVVGNNKVFAIETKAVSKPQSQSKKNGRDATVVFDGQQLIFPHMKTSDPIKQAQRHATHIRKVLKKNCGVNIEVVPVVALPGWFIDTKSAGLDVLVINPKRGKALDKWLGNNECKIEKNKVAVYIASVARSISARSVLTDPDANEKYDFWLNPKYVETSMN